MSSKENQVPISSKENQVPNGSNSSADETILLDGVAEVSDYSSAFSSSSSRGEELNMNNVGTSVASSTKNSLICYEEWIKNTKAADELLQPYSTSPSQSKRDWKLFKLANPSSPLQEASLKRSLDNVWTWTPNKLPSPQSKKQRLFPPAGDALSSAGQVAIDGTEPTVDFLTKVTPSSPSPLSPSCGKPLPLHPRTLRPISALLAPRMLAKPRQRQCQQQHHHQLPSRTL